MHMRPPIIQALAPVICAAVISCSVDYAGILDGKACDMSGICATDYLCDTASWKCVPAREFKNPDGGGLLVDGGHGGGDASRDADLPGGGPVDTGSDGAHPRRRRHGRHGDGETGDAGWGVQDRRRG